MRNILKVSSHLCLTASLYTFMQPQCSPYPHLYIVKHLQCLRWHFYSRKDVSEVYGSLINSTFQTWIKYQTQSVPMYVFMILKDSENTFKHVLIFSAHLWSKALFHAVLSKEAIILHSILCLKGSPETIFF